MRSSVAAVVSVFVMSAVSAVYVVLCVMLLMAGSPLDFGGIRRAIRASVDLYLSRRRSKPVRTGPPSPALLIP
jgi:hypothetical protein